MSELLKEMRDEQNQKGFIRTQDAASLIVALSQNEDGLPKEKVEEEEDSKYHMTTQQYEEMLSTISKPRNKIEKDAYGNRRMSILEQRLEESGYDMSEVRAQVGKRVEEEGIDPSDIEAELRTALDRYYAEQFTKRKVALKQIAHLVNHMS